jgi:hypothetical protein
VIKGEEYYASFGAPMQVRSPDWLVAGRWRGCRTGDRSVGCAAPCELPNSDEALMRTSSRVSAVCASAILLGTILVGAGSARADDYIDCAQGYGVCGPDDYTHYYCYGTSLDGKPSLKDAADWVMTLMENQTVMTTVLQSSCASATDVRFHDLDLGFGTRGRYECTTWAGSDHPQVCAAAAVRLDYDQIVLEANDSSWAYSDGVEENGEVRMNVRKTYCHEAGHSLGFLHHPVGDSPPARANFYDGSGPTYVRDCMVRQHIESGDDGWLKYNQHHQDHLADFLS